MAKTGFAALAALFGKGLQSADHLVFRNICPVCDQQLSSQRLVTGSALCSCGWMDDRAAHALDTRIEKNTLKSFVAFAVVFVVGYGHVLSWGQHALTIPVLKTSRLVGLISVTGLESIVDACMDQRKWACVESTFVDLYKKTGDIEYVSKLAHLQSRQLKNKEALTNYEIYAKAGGMSPDSMLRYAMLADEAGNGKEAIALYTKTISLSKDKLPVRAMAGLLKLLMAGNRNREALIHLRAFHKSSGNAKSYFVSELETLNEAVSGRKVAGR